jgi:hypothetical protein
MIELGGFWQKWLSETIATTGWVPGAGESCPSTGGPFCGIGVGFDLQRLLQRMGDG